MKFTTSDEKEHLNQPIHLCLATLCSCASSASPLRFQATLTLRAGTLELKAQAMGWSLGLVGWGLP